MARDGVDAHPRRQCQRALLCVPLRSSAVELSFAQILASGYTTSERMALVVFLRGVNVGGHRTFRPSVLARALSDYDVVNVGAAGTFVVRKPGSRTKFRAELLRQLPFEADVMLCDGRDLLRLDGENPFVGAPAHENDRLPRQDRQALRCAGYDTELEHDRCNRADL
jgi:hypothetical protein